MFDFDRTCDLGIRKHKGISIRTQKPDSKITRSHVFTYNRSADWSVHHASFMDSKLYDKQLLAANSGAVHLPEPTNNGLHTAKHGFDVISFDVFSLLLEGRRSRKND